MTKRVARTVCRANAQIPVKLDGEAIGTATKVEPGIFKIHIDSNHAAKLEDLLLSQSSRPEVSLDINFWGTNGSTQDEGPGQYMAET